MASSSSYGLPRPPDDYGAGCPRWMDPEGKHGKVIVLSLKAANDNVLPKNHPFIVGKSIQSLIGDAYTAVTEARGTKYIVKVRNQAHANKLFGMQSLFDGTPVEITAHPTLNYSRCIVSCPEVLEMTQEELQAELAPQGVTSVRRLTKTIDKMRVNTPTLVLTLTGTTWPQFIYFGALRVPTRIYFPAPMLCYGCLEYGHTRIRCQNPSRCQNCSSPDHKSEDCTDKANCFHCKQEHKPIDRNCSMYKMENEIVRIKVEQGLTYPEAKKCYDSRFNSKSYASISKKRDEGNQDAKDKEIANLKEQLAALRSQLSSVIGELKNHPNCQCRMESEGGSKECKKDQRSKRAKEVSPEATSGAEFRPPPMKKVVAANAEYDEPKQNNNVDTPTEEGGTLTATEIDSEGDTIYINRKHRKKHHRNKNDLHNQ